MAEISSITPQSPHLETVKCLHRDNSRTLGPFPDGAFQEYAEKGTILVATEEGQCVGYLLYRYSRQRLSIAHLCVDQRHRGKRIARDLVQHLIGIGRQYRGIKLNCRPDYDASTFWPKMGFVAVDHPIGRGKAGKRLVTWWYGDDDTGLFSARARASRDARTPVALDANVFFDLTVRAGTPQADRSSILLADWLEDELELCVTDELFNEIAGNPDEGDRLRSHRAAATFERITGDNQRFCAVCEEVRKLFPNPSRQDDADARHISRAIAAGVGFFLTHELKLQRMSGTLEERYGLKVLSPLSLVNHLDQQRNQEAYRPSAFAGSVLRVRRVTPEDTSVLEQYLCQVGQGETVKKFRELLRRLLSSPKSVECWMLMDANPLAAWALSNRDDDTVEVQLLRVRRGPLAPTVALQITRRCVTHTVRARRRFTHVTDKSMQVEVLTALDYFGFAEVNPGWLRAAMYVIASAAEVGQTLATYRHDSIEPEGYMSWGEMIAEQSHEPTAASYDEHLLWPLKIIGSGIPSYVLPIKAVWAAELFDDALAGQVLYCRRHDLALNVEGIFYSAAKPSSISSPGRVLWYVSQESGREGTGMIRACSRVLEVASDVPKELFRKYRRLGIYEWKDVLATARGDMSRKIMAVHFGDTELLPRPISLSVLRRIAKLHGKGVQLQGPWKLLPEQFFRDLYKAGQK